MAYAFNDDKSKFDLDETVDNVDSLIGNMATIETSPVTTNHSAGEYVMYNGTLFKVLSPIATGENLVLGTNVTPINFGNEIKSLQDSVSPFTDFLIGPEFDNLLIPFGAYNTTGQIIEVPDLRSYRAFILRFGYNTGNTSGGGGEVLRFIPRRFLQTLNDGNSAAFECTYYQNGLASYGTITFVDHTHIKILNAQGNFTLRTIYGIR